MTLDIDTHGIEAIATYFNVHHISRPVAERIDFTKKGYHMIFWYYTNKPEITEHIRNMFDDWRRVKLDSTRPSYQRQTLWTKKAGFEVIKDIDITRGSMMI